MRAVDLFAGPGGWDLAGRELGLDPLGVELDDAACATREAAGLRTVQGDVSALDPEEFAPVELLIASPPCQAFSMAGKGAGRAAMSAYLDAITRWMEGKPPSREELDEACHDERGHLVLEVLRWVLAVRPRFVACEQVKPVLPLWEAIAGAFASVGYGTWTGVLSAERYGVPQTRQRAFLLASLDGPVCAPRATHQRYVVPRRRDEQAGLFDAPERVVHPEDRELLPWVSMAEALGWGMTARPYPVIAGGTGGGPDLEKVGGSAARAQLYAEQAAGRWAGVFEPNGRRTQSGRHADGEWTGSRPATTIAGDPRVFSPGGHIAHDGRNNDLMVGRSQNAIRVHLSQALVLQSFPPDYPVQGTGTKQFEQVGNAVPPLLARAVLAELLGGRGDG